MARARAQIDAQQVSVDLACVQRALQAFVKQDQIQLTLRCFAALLVLHSAGPLTDVELGKLLGVHRATAWRMARALCEGGLAERVSIGDVPDRRKRQQVHLLPKGIEQVRVLTDNLATL